MDILLPKTMKKHPLRIVHLSDLHLSPKYYPERSHRLNNALRQATAHKADHIIVSGDITNQALPDEFAEFRRIIADHGLLDGNRLTVVPGNHDIFGGPYHAEDVLEFPAQCQRTDYDRKLSLFHRNTEELFATAVPLDPQHRYPFVKNLGSTAIVIGLNSVTRWSPLKNPLGSNGLVDDAQFDLLKSFLQSGAVEEKNVFIVIHHHLHKTPVTTSASKLERLWNAIEDTTMKMRKKKRLLRLFSRSGIAGVFHGHVHSTEEYRRRSIPCYNAGGSIVPSRHRPISFHLLSVSPTDIERISLSSEPVLEPVRRKRTFASPSLTTAA